MKMGFYKTRELNGSIYVKIPLRSKAILKNKNDYEYYFLWSKLASLLPCNIYNLNRVSNQRQNFDELNNEGFEFSNGFKCSDVHMFEKWNNLSITIYEFSFYQDQNRWRRKLIPIEISKNDESNRVVDLLIYTNHYALIKKLNVFLGDQIENFICTRCLNSFTSENMLMIHKP